MVVQASFRMSGLVSIRTFDETKIVFCSTLLVGLYKTFNWIFTNLSFESLGSGIWIDFNYDWAAVVLLRFIQIYTFSEAFLVCVFFCLPLASVYYILRSCCCNRGGGGDLRLCCPPKILAFWLVNLLFPSNGDATIVGRCSGVIVSCLHCGAKPKGSNCSLFK